MKTKYAKLNQNGSALVTVMLVLAVGALATGGLYTFAANMAHQSRMMTDSMRARAIAEAGINEAFSLFYGKFYSLRQADVFDTPRDFAGGQYKVSYTIESPGQIRLISVGTYRSATHAVGLQMKDENVKVLKDYLSEASFLADGNMIFNGAPADLSADLHTNAKFTLNGSFNNVTGKISAREGADSIPEAFRAYFEEREFPEDIAAFKDHIIEISKSDPVFHEVDGLRLQGDHTLDGIWIVKGDTTFIGAGNREINGILYVIGDLTVNGSTTLQGVIMVTGEITINGSSAVLSHDLSVLDLHDPDETAKIVVEAWWHDSPESTDQSNTTL